MDNLICALLTVVLLLLIWYVLSSRTEILENFRRHYRRFRFRLPIYTYYIPLAPDCIDDCYYSADKFGCMRRCKNL